MGKPKGSLTADRVRFLLNYDPATGAFTWLNPTSHRVKRGDRAGYIAQAPSGRYRVIGVDGKGWRSSALAVLYVTGEFPPVLVDHENHDTLDDRFENLRPATYQENTFNTGVHHDNKVGLKGVHVHKSDGRFRAQIRVGKRYHLGLFDTAEEAHAAYMEAAQKLHGKFFMGGYNR